MNRQPAVSLSTIVCFAASRSKAHEDKIQSIDLSLHSSVKSRNRRPPDIVALGEFLGREGPLGIVGDKPGRALAHYVVENDKPLVTWL
jgi:hypothetical protein